jgi:HK97 family phage prohead protease
MADAPKALLTRAATFEIRAAGDDGFTLEGYAAVFGATTRIDSWEGTFDERIERGAFAKTLKERSPVIQFDHGHDIATGSVPIAAVNTIREDTKGLWVSARMFDNPRVEPIRQAIAGGAIDGMSFRFRVTREEWDESGDIPLRTIRELELFELGPVVFPAYAATSVGVRSLLADLDEAQRLELLADISGVDAARQGTSTPPPKNPDAAHEGTSGTSGGRDPRAALTIAAAMRLRKDKS